MGTYKINLFQNLVKDSHGLLIFFFFAEINRQSVFMHTFSFTNRLRCVKSMLQYAISIDHESTQRNIIFNSNELCFKRILSLSNEFPWNFLHQANRLSIVLLSIYLL